MPTFETPRPDRHHVDIARRRARHRQRPGRHHRHRRRRPTLPSAADVSRGRRHPGRVRRRPPDDQRPEELAALLPLRPRRLGAGRPIEVPTGSSLEASSALGDLRLDGELGRCRVKTGDGQHPPRPLRRRSRSRPATATSTSTTSTATPTSATGSGDVRDRPVDGAADRQELQRRHAIDDVTGDLRVQAANGGIRSRGPGGRSSAKTATGDRRRRGPPRRRRARDRRPATCRCGIAAGTAAYLDVRSQSGRIRNALDASRRSRAEPTRSSSCGPHTSVGDITLIGRCRPRTDAADGPT